MSCFHGLATKKDTILWFEKNKNSSPDFRKGRKVFLWLLSNSRRILEKEYFSKRLTSKFRYNCTWTLTSNVLKSKIFSYWRDIVQFYRLQSNRFYFKGISDVLILYIERKLFIGAKFNWNILLVNDLHKKVFFWRVSLLDKLQ